MTLQCHETENGKDMKNDKEKKNVKRRMERTRGYQGEKDNEWGGREKQKELQTKQ